MQYFTNLFNPQQIIMLYVYTQFPINYQPTQPCVKIWSTMKLKMQYIVPIFKDNGNF